MTRLNRHLPPLIGALLLPPSLLACAVVWSAPKAPPMRTDSRSGVLASVPHHKGVLINIRTALFPATWDITLLGQRATAALGQGLLGNTDAGVRWRCAQVLAQLRDASSRADLHQALGDWNDKVRGQVLRALANVGDSSSVPHILKRLADPQESLQNRVLALRAMGKLGDGRAADAIIGQYDHSGAPTMLRRAAIEALWDLRRKVPQDKLRATLRRAIADGDPTVARRAAIGSGILQDAGAIAALQQRLRGSDPMLRNVAAYVLGRIGDKRGIAVLVKALPRVRSGRLLNNISFALRRLGDARLWDRLKGFLGHRQAFIRLNAAFTVGEMQLKQAAVPLRKMLRDPNVLVRVQAVVALAKIGDGGAVAPLRRYAETATGDGRFLANLAVLYLGKRPEHREPFIQMLAGPRRGPAALLLAAHGDRRVAPMLYQMARSSRSRAVWAATDRLHDPVLQRLLLQRLRSDLQSGRLATLDRLLERTDAATTRKLALPLLELLFGQWQPVQQRRRVHRPHALRAVLAALGRSGDPQVRPWLELYARHPAYRVKMAALVALAQLGDDKSQRTLVLDLVQASDHHRPFLVRLLAPLPLDRLKQLLEPYQQRKDPFLRLALAAVLYQRHSDARGLSQLLQGLRSPLSTVRARAADYLGLGLDRTRSQALRSLAGKESDPMARDALATLADDYTPVLQPFRVFKPRKIVLR